MSDGASAPVYLHSYLAPFADLLARADVTDIYVNRPHEIWVETLGGATELHPSANLSEATLHRLARQIAAISHQGISREHPLLSASLPGGERVQIALPPATRGTAAFAIRKHVSPDLSLADYVEAGAFSHTVRGGASNGVDIDDKLAGLLEAGDMSGLLSAAVGARKNILISGGTSTGKTTFLNALIREIPESERLILIEDTPELYLRHANGVGLLATRSELGEARVTANDLLSASLRMRPDRIIVGELRGPEAFTFLRAVNTGHPGSMTTVHADSAARAIEQIALLVLQSGAGLRRDEVQHYVKSTIDVYVQLARIAGRRHVAQIVLERHRL
ncbi:MAG: P-type DNA transfer ATPase VirB11 [Sphingomonas sp.]